MFKLSGIRRISTTRSFLFLSLTPLLIIAIAVRRADVRRAGPTADRLSQFQGLLGEQAARIIQTMSGPMPDVAANCHDRGSRCALIGATGAVAALQDSLNTIWKVRPKSNLGVFLPFKNWIASSALRRTRNDDHFFRNRRFPRVFFSFKAAPEFFRSCASSIDL